MDRVKEIFNKFFGAGFNSNLKTSSGAPTFSMATQNIFDPRHWPNGYDHLDYCSMCHANPEDTWACQMCDPVMGELSWHNVNMLGKPNYEDPSHYYPNDLLAKKIISYNRRK